MSELDVQGSLCDGYLFTLQPRQLVEFAGMCNYHQTSAKSSFTRQRICSMATPDGRVTLSDLRLIITHNGNKVERLLTQEEYQTALEEYFGMIL